MNNPHKKLETLLSNQNQVGLTESEKSVMFSELQAFADLHTPRTSTTAHPHSSYVWFSRWAVSIAGVFLVFAGTGFASTQSLPGDTLYGVKVSIVEPIIGLAYVDHSEQLSYHVVLFERRLQEMESLYRAGALSETEAQVLEVQIMDQAEELSALITETVGGDISPGRSVEAVSEVVTLIKKQNLLVEKELGVSRPSPLDEVVTRVDQLYEGEVTEFVTSEPGAVAGYVEELLKEVAEQVEADPGTASSSAFELQTYLDQVDKTLEEGDLKQAVESAEEATQLLEANSFSETLSGSVVELKFEKPN